MYKNSSFGMSFFLPFIVVAVSTLIKGSTGSKVL